MTAPAQYNERLDHYRKKALDMYQAKDGLRYSFTHFEGVYTELTYYMVSHILAQHGLEFLDNILMNLMRESISNAVKANLKRAFFESRGADIADQKSYNEVMEDFKNEGVSKLKDHIETIKKMNLCVQLKFDIRSEKLRFIIENNTAMNADELSRVRRRVDAAAKLESLTDAFEQFQDEQEGAGLGLLISIMLLKKAGIGPENFRIASDQNKTHVCISVPRKLKTPESIAKLYEKVFEEVKNIPSFPQSIKQVLDLCDNPDSNVSSIAAHVEKDPALATNILKLANSGGFLTGKKVNNIQQAVAITGIQNLRQLAMAHSSRNILEHQYKIYESFWQHAEKCAAYSRMLARKLGFLKLADSVYLGGLLHDLGKIILLALDPDEIGKIQGINMGRSQDSSAILEEISLGLSHANVGASLASHWNFPEDIQAIIRHHHSVYTSNPEYIIEVSLVHLANAFLNTEEARGSYVYYDETCLDRLDIKSVQELQQLHNSIKAEYEIHNDL